MIAADGHWSPVRRALEPDAPRDLGEWHAVRQYFADVNDARLWVLFERDLLPGYAWVFPLPDGGANVGYGVLRADGRSGKRPQGAVARAARARPCSATSSARTRAATEPVRAWPIPTRYDPARLANGRVLFVGDAAGVVDPMTGEGIAQALETGVLAAESIAAGGDPTTSRARYRRHVGRALGRDLRFASALQSLLRYSARRACRDRRRRRSRRGPAATSPAGCSRTIPARCCSRPTAGGAARSRHRARTG